MKRRSAIRLFNQFGEYFLYAGMGFLVFLLVFQPLLKIPAWLEVAGRMHPMFLHFPLVLLLFAFLSLWIPFKKEQYPWLDTLRLTAALSAVVTAIMGMLLALGEGRNGDVLEWHKWTGVGVAVIGYIFYFYFSFFVSRLKAGKTFTLASLAVIIFAGHFGAELTHGENYLFEPISRANAIPVDPAKAHVFKDVIKPILDQNCAKCHSKGNMKGELQLNDTAGLLAGGKTGPLFVPGDANGSLLLQRIHLPMSDKKRMPPRSERQLTYDEVMLLRAWIATGAAINTTLSELNEQDSFRLLATRYLGPPPSPEKNIHYDFKAADDSKIRSLNNHYRVITPLGAGSPALAVSFFGSYAYTPKSLEEILPLKQQIVELNLSKMPVKDEELNIVKQITNLRKLNLNLTDISSKGLDHLRGMKNLSEISLSGTAVDAEGLEKLLSIPTLSSIFVWETKIDSAQLADIRGRFKKVSIYAGYTGGDTTIIALTPPIIETPAGVFNNLTEIKLKHPFQDAVIRYTLDGSVPDSLHGEIYKGPISLDKTTTFKARAFKDGWYSSREVSAVFLRKGRTPDSLELISPPDPRFAGAAPLLLDEELGDLNFNDGRWLAYQHNEASFYLYFDEETPVKQILLNVLSQTGSHIFPPTKVEVWGGMTKDHMTLLGRTTPEVPSQHFNSLAQEKVEFDPTTVKVLKVVASPLKKLPDWHPGKGQAGWVFMNEVVVE